MKIIEQSVIAKSPRTDTEDGIVITDDFIAVIDGSTNKTNKRITPEITNGRYCMLLISEYINHLQTEVSVNEFCVGVSLYIMQHYKNSNTETLAHHPEHRLAASCIIYSKFHQQVWMIGDCQCLIDTQYHDNPKPEEAILAEKRAVAAKRLLDSGQYTVPELRVNDVSRSEILPEMIVSMQNQNKTYSVIDGFPIPQEKVKIIPVPSGSSTIILASDGYPFLKSTLAESEAALQIQLESDPLNIQHFKATKAFMAGNNSFDDRAYVRFEISAAQIPNYHNTPNRV